LPGKREEAQRAGMMTAVRWVDMEPQFLTQPSENP
jgi:hypothetical protein